MSQLVEFPLEDGSSIAVAVDEARPVTRGSRREAPGEAIGKASKTLEQALDGIGPTAAAIVQKLRAGIDSPHEIEVEFGVTLSSEVGAIVARASGEAHFKIVARWRPPGGP